MKFSQQQRQVFEEIAKHEKIIEAQRIELNQQIQFNLKDLYLSISNESSCINVRHLFKFFKASSLDKKSLTRFVLFYNQNSSLNLTFIEFAMIFLSKTNKLLSKMVIERDQLGIMPNFIFHLVNNIIKTELQLHLIIQKLLQLFNKRFLCMQHQELKILLKHNNFNNEEIQNIVSYLSDKNDQCVFKKRMNHLFGQKEQSLIKTKSQAFFKTIKNNNYKIICPQLDDCINRSTIKEIKSYRQIKSIQKHVERVNQMIIPMKQKVKTIAEMNSTCVAFLNVMRQIIFLEEETQYFRTELCLCLDFYPILFYEGFWKDSKGTVPLSSVKEYLSSFNLYFNVSHLYPFYHRYCLSKQMNFNEFCRIFNLSTTAYRYVQRNRQIKKLQDVCLNTKKTFLSTFSMAIINQFKIQNLKISLSRFVVFQQVFQYFNFTSLINQIDMQKAFQKYLQIQLTVDQLKILWFCLGIQENNKFISKDALLQKLTPKGKINFKMNGVKQ